MFVVLLALVIQVVLAQRPLPRDSKYDREKWYNRRVITAAEQSKILEDKQFLLKPSGDVLYVRFLLLNDATPMVIRLKLNDEIIYDAGNGTKNSPIRYTSETETCGTVKVRSTPLITYGEDTSEGEWPWHAAIYRNGVFDCGGSLISHKHVLTAAHCVTKFFTDYKVNEHQLHVSLGKHSLYKQSEHEQISGVSEIIVHPEFHFKYAKNDIAVIELDSIVEITDYVRPVCLWEKNESLDTIVGRHGTVVGWGKDETGKISEHLRQVVMPVVSTEVCTSIGYNHFSSFTLGRIFCADVVNGAALCHSDSGGGMVFPKIGPGNILIWQLRGVLFGNSHSHLECAKSKYNFFNDVAKYLNWIKPIIQ